MQLPRREFSYCDADFLTIARMVREHAGISLGDSKRDLVYSRLSRRLRALGFDDFSDYCALLEGPQGDAERGLMVNAITTNLTGFFREPHHFRFLASKVIPGIVKSGSRIAGRLRIWSAGCSSGEEPYSIAMTVRDALGNTSGYDAKILATDIDTQMIATAEAGRYPVARVASVPVDLQKQFLRRVDDEHVIVSDELKSMVVFKPLNLFDPWPMHGPFDVIFCRNVIIYFDNNSKRVLFNRFAEIMKPGGWMFIGHSETLFRVSERFRHVGRTIHRRVA